MTTLTLQSTGGVSQWDVSYWDDEYWDGTLDNFTSSIPVTATTKATSATTLSPATAGFSVAARTRLSSAVTLDGATSNIQLFEVLGVAGAMHATLGDATSSAGLRIKADLVSGVALSSFTGLADLRALTTVRSSAVISNFSSSIPVTGTTKLSSAIALQDATPNISAGIRADLATGATTADFGSSGSLIARTHLSSSAQLENVTPGLALEVSWILSLSFNFTLEGVSSGVNLRRKNQSFGGVGVKAVQPSGIYIGAATAGTNETIPLVGVSGVALVDTQPGTLEKLPVRPL